MEKMIIGLYAVSQIHAGVGSDTGIVDLPIQRERLTGYPIIRGVKGAFRHQVELDKETVEDIFGPEIVKGEEHHAGGLSFSEARILLFPVRGLREPFYYVTCPQVLKRFKRDAGVELEISGVGKKEVLYWEDGIVHLEGMRVNAKKSELVERVWKAIEGIIPDEFKGDVQRRLVIVSDELFGYLVRTTTEVVPRIRIDDTKGTVKQGGLWYEEYLPMDSVMYVVVRDRGLERNKDKNLLELLKTKIDGRTITLGGKVGVGAGFMVVKVM